LFWLIFQVGEIAKVTCKPEYAYGSSGSPPEYYSDIIPQTFFFWIIIVEYRSSKMKITTKKNNEKREYAGYEARVETRTLTI
jgi:peptidylprolyl isomerase